MESSYAAWLDEVDTDNASTDVSAGSSYSGLIRLTDGTGNESGALLMTPASGRAAAMSAEVDVTPIACVSGLEQFARAGVLVAAENELDDEETGESDAWVRARAGVRRRLAGACRLLLVRARRFGIRG
jgi:hypothetical protein